jgi:uncharacterized repeat protein (TIGR03803 family)
LLYSFKGGKRDGSFPFAPLVLDKAGNIYGTTQDGGGLCRRGGCGTVFELKTNGKESVLVAFDGGDGWFPASLVADGQHNLFGVTGVGGDGNGKQCIGYEYGCGTVFELPRSGGLTVLHNFDGDDGFLPCCVFPGKSGNLYGATAAGGSKNHGTLFEVSPDGTETTLYSFVGKTSGADPRSVLVPGDKGKLYGTTEEGGDVHCSQGRGCGTIFEFKLK